MTDTTGIKALREECAQWVKEAIGEAVDTRMALNGDGNNYMSWDMSVIWLAWLHLSGKLEAERQRADANDAEWRAQEERAEKAEEKLAEMKGDQVPVAEIKFDSSTDKHPCMYWFGKQDRDFPVGTRFFTATQKPVVLPKSHYVCGCADRFMSAPEVIAAIEAAGGIVSTSDERLMQDMSGIVKDGE